MKGFSLIELLVVIAITAILSVFSYESIVNFQYQSQVESAAQELVSTIRDAQTKSRSGYIPAGTTAASYSVTGLPVYSVVLNGFSYALHRTDTLAAGTVEDVDESTHTLAAALTVTPSTETIVFARVTGLPDHAATFTLTRGSATTMKTISVSANGLITVQ